MKKKLKKASISALVGFAVAFISAVIMKYLNTSILITPIPDFIAGYICGVFYSASYFTTYELL